MERLMFNVYRELSKEFDLALIGPSGCRACVDDGDSVYDCTLSPLSLFLMSVQIKAFAVARKKRPDFIISGSGLTAPAALIAARSIGVPVLCYLHGLDVVTPSRVYRGAFLPAIRRCDVILVNSGNTGRLAADSGVPPARIRVLHPGVSRPEAVEKHDLERFRNDIGIGKESKILLSVGRLTKRKGLVEFVEKVLPEVVREHRDLFFVVCGEEARDSLKRSPRLIEKIQAAASAAGVMGQIRFLGHATDRLLTCAYAASDLLVFPVLDLPDDVEGFGMVAIEAAASGLPTVAFSAGGVPDAVKDGASGYLVSPGDYHGFRDAVLRHLKRGDRQSWRERCVNHASAFHWDEFGARLRSICRDMTNDRGKE